MNLKLAKAIVAIDAIRQITKKPIFESFPEYVGIVENGLEDIHVALEHNPSIEPIHLSIIREDALFLSEVLKEIFMGDSDKAKSAGELLEVLSRQNEMFRYWP